MEVLKWIIPPQDDFKNKVGDLVSEYNLTMNVYIENVQILSNKHCHSDEMISSCSLNSQ